jgi:hypothetical protein
MRNNIYNNVRAYLNANSVEYDLMANQFEITDDNGTQTITKWDFEIAEPTQEQLTALSTEATAIAEADVLAVTNKANTKASGNTKLLDLGLTQAEATALTGYVPPAEV